MTAINLFTQGDAAFLLTDGAVTDLSGTLLAIEGKVAAFPRLGLAICMTGFGIADFGADTTEGVSNDRLNLALAAAGVTDAVSHAQATSKLPYALRALHRDNLASFAARDDVADRSAILVAVAAWNPDKSTAMAYLGSTEPLGDLPPYAFVPVRQYVTAFAARSSPSEAVAAALGRPANLTSPASFDPRRDGLRLLSGQRAIRGGPCAGDYHSIGGKAFLTKVSAAGIETEELHTWTEDKVGEPIQPVPLAA